MKTILESLSKALKAQATFISGLGFCECKDLPLETLTSAHVAVLDCQGHLAKIEAELAATIHARTS